MANTGSRKRPWLAALLSAAISGLGHVYLRRVRRGLAWVAIVTTVSFLFVPQEALSALWSSGDIDVNSIGPLLIVGTLCTIDSYVMAKAHNLRARASSDQEAEFSCPNCEKPADPERGFCQWCSAEFSGDN
jgi:TM2 domain-containing membrane protein YozV